MKRLGFLVLTLVLVLGSLGVGYALWSDTVTLNASVSSGTVSWAFYNCRMADRFSPAVSGGYVWPGPSSGLTQADWISAFGDLSTQNGFVGGQFQLDKNVSWGTCSIAPDGKTLNITLHNTYPCNFNELSFYVKNTGTVPIKVWKAEILDNNGIVKAIYYAESQVGTAGIALDLDGDSHNDVEVRYGDNFGVQIHGGEESPAEFSLWFHTLQPAPQGATLSFSIRVTAVQWNEYVPNGGVD